MPYYLIDDFSKGMDTRRNVASGPAGSLRLIENGFVNRGGEIERRMVFKRIYAVDALYDTTNGNIQGVVGPIPGFEPNSCWFIVNTVDGGTADGGGAKVSDGSMEFGAIAHALGGTGDGFSYVLAAAGYADQQIVTAIRDSQLFYKPGGTIPTYSQLDVAHAVGTVTPASIANVAGRSGTMPSGTSGVMTDFTAAFSSLIGILPNSHQIEKSNTGAPEAAGGTGAGFIEARGQAEYIGRLIGIERYFNQIAVFGSRGVQFWDIDSDVANFSYSNTVVGDGAVSPRAILPWADGDILYLSKNGIRSLRARDESNFVRQTDIGSPIDGEIYKQINALGQSGERDAVLAMSLAIVNEDDGQAWFVIQDKIYVLSYYPDVGVSAWSTFTVDAFGGSIPIAGDSSLTYFQLGNSPEGWIADIAVVGGRPVVRKHGSAVYVYGNTNPTYRDYTTLYTTTVETHYLGIDDPFTLKQFTGVDVACVGEWIIYVSLDPDNEDWVEVATVSSSTHYSHSIDFEMEGYLIAVKAECLGSNTETPESLSQIAIHYEKTSVRD